MKTAKTNAVRLLDTENINYKLATYVVDEADLSAVHVAQTMGLEDAGQIFKTLVLHGDKMGHFVCLVSGDEELDLKKAAQASGNKKAEMIAMKDLLSITGYIRGACSPIGMKKLLPSYIDKTCEKYEIICISAGKKGWQIQLKPKDLIGLINMEIKELS